MPPKKQIQLDKKISEIIIVNNKKLAPYIEAVNFGSRNIDQRHLGTILGIFEIKDTSKDSAYIVNFLASVAKKTYFNGKRKTVADSFEATLSKINLSLSELARHGNINWLGKIDAVICSIHNNQINFSVSGDAKILLLRNQKLLEISGDLSPKDEAVNPIKTFTDIASGRLEDGDKLILTTDDISHIFTLSDLENNALSFSNKNFLRFLKTALVNELEIAGTIIVDIFKKAVVPKKTISQNNKNTKKLNAFSSTTFKKTLPTKEAMTSSKKDDSREDISPENNSQRKNPSDEILKKQDDFINKKTGHIYVKSSGEKHSSIQDNQFENWVTIFQEKLFEFGLWLKNRYLHKCHYNIKKYFFPIFTNTHKKILFLFKKTVSNCLHKTKLFSRTLSKKISVQSIKSKTIIKNVSFKKSLPTDTVEKITDNHQSNLKAKQHSLKIKSNILNFSKKLFFTPSLIKKILPHPKAMKTYFRKMNPKQKLYTIVIISMIFILPLIFLKLADKKQSNEKIIPSPSDNNSQNALSINPNSTHHADTKQLYQDKQNLLGVFPFNGTIFTISENKLTKITSGNQQDFLFPDYFGKVTAYSFMDDLNLLFLLDENKKLISFSPISRKFKNNNISIPENAKIGAIETYLTYIYLVDIENNQIYRYPRTEGGFGKKTNWLKENINLKDVSTIAIGDSIFLLNSNNSVTKLSKGKIQSFKLKIDEDSTLKSIFTNRTSSYLYVLDNLNGEIILFDKDGNKIDFFSNQNLTEAKNIVVNKKGDKIYFITNKKLFQIKGDFLK